MKSFLNTELCWLGSGRNYFNNVPRSLVRMEPKSSSIHSLEPIKPSGLLGVSERLITHRAGANKENFSLL